MKHLVPCVCRLRLPAAKQESQAAQHSLESGPFTPSVDVSRGAGSDEKSYSTQTDPDGAVHPVQSLVTPQTKLLAGIRPSHLGSGKFDIETPIYYTCHI